MATENAGKDSNPEKAITQTLASTSIMGVKLYILILIFVGILICSCFLLLLCLIRRKNKLGGRNRVFLRHNSGIIPLVSTEIRLIDDKNGVKRNLGEILKGDKTEEIGILVKGGGNGRSKSAESSDGSSSSKASVISSDIPNIGWGRWYSLRELELATRGFSDEYIIGEGGYGIVYKGILEDGSIVAVKNLLNNKYVFLLHNFL